VEQFDRLAEGIARSSLRWMWEELKESARSASAALPTRKALEWPARSSAQLDLMAASPGAALLVDRMRRYVAAAAPEPVHLHLVGHGAGALLLPPLVDNLHAARLTVSTLVLLAPAMRVDSFAAGILPHIEAGGIQRLVVFTLDDERELDDTIGENGRCVYHKSLLYLVSRALEAPDRHGRGEAPLVGLERCHHSPLAPGSPRSMGEVIDDLGGVRIVAPAEGPRDRRSEATGHSSFDDDPHTMTAVLLQMLRDGSPRDITDYLPFMSPRAHRAAPRGGFVPEALARQGWHPDEAD
jgi:hypothetical protein